MGKKGGRDLSGFDGLFGEGTGASVLGKKEIWFLQSLSREERGVGHKREGQNHVYFISEADSRPSISL